MDNNRKSEAIRVYLPLSETNPTVVIRFQVINNPKKINRIAKLSSFPPARIFLKMKTLQTKKTTSGESK